MKHIIERAIVPHNPSASSIINKEQYNLYAPVAGQGKVGMAAFDLRDFEVKNQTVFLHANVREGIDKALSLEADIIKNTENIAKNAGDITKNAGDIAINTGNITKNAGDITKNADAIKDITKAISDLEDFDITHEAEFKEFVEKVNDLLDMSDTDLDEYHEVLTLIKSNRDSLQHLGTNKIDKSKIVDNLKTALADHVLSANQGVILKNLITALESALNTEVTNRESAVTSEENARKTAITDEANARSSADATHTAGIAALKARLDSLDLPVIQHSLYEHSVLITTRDPNVPRPYVFLRCSIFNRISERLGLPEVLECLHSTLGKGTTLKTFSGYVEYNASNGVAIAEVVDLTTTLPTEILKYELSEDGNSYICVGFADGYDYTDILMDVIIPPEYNGKPVRAIAGNAFVGQYIKSCVVPPTVTDIGYWAFGMNETLEYVYIPSSVTSIEGNAFTYSSNVSIYCEAAEQPSGWSSSWNSDNRPVTWSSPVPDTALYVRYYDTSGVRNLLKVSSSKISVYDAVSTVAQVSEGGGGNAIIECLTLPTENISVTHLYRTSDGKLHWYDGSTWHRVVEESDLPKDSNGGYFEGTASEYNAVADTVPVGAIVWLTDEEGNLTTAVLDKAILGQMILGTS